VVLLIFHGAIISTNTFKTDERLMFLKFIEVGEKHSEVKKYYYFN
jgi:hypothetical protein